MASSLAEAAVEIIAEIDRFSDDLQRRLQRAADRAAKAAERSFSRVEKRADSVGRRIAQALGDGARRGYDALRRIPLAARGFAVVERAAARLGQVLGPRITAGADLARRALDRIRGAGATLARIGTDAAAAGRAVAFSLIGASERAKAALATIDSERFGRVAAAASAAAARVSAAFTAAAGRARASLASINLAGAAAGVRTFAGAFAVATGAVVGFGLKSAGSLEQTQIAFTGLLGSAKEAAAFIQELQAFAAKTPFEFAGLSAAARQLLAIGKAAGISRKEILPTLTTIGDMAATLGAGQPEIDLVVRALGQMASKGKTSSEELMQISEAMPGFSAVAAVAAAKGVSTAEAFKMIEDGAITGREGVDAILKGMKNFQGAAGAMERQSQTLFGVLSTFKDTISLSLTRAFQPLIPTVKQTLSRLTPEIDRSLSQIAPRVGKFVQKLGPILEKLVPAATPGIVAIFDGLSRALDGIEPGKLQEAGDAAADLLNALAPLAPAIVSLVGSGLQILGPILVAITPAVRVLAEALADLAASPAGDFLGPLVAQFLLVRALTGSSGRAFAAVGASLKLLGKGALGAGKLLAGLVSRIPGITGLFTRLAALGPLVARGFAALRLGSLISLFARLGPLLLGLFRIGRLAAIFRAVGAAAMWLGRALWLAVISNPVTAAIAAIAAGLLFVATRFESVRRVIGRVGGALLAGGKSFLGFIGDVVSAFREGGIEAGFKRIGDGITSALRTGLEKAAGFVKQNAGAILGALVPVIGIPMLLNKFGPQLLEVFQAAFERVQAALPGLVAKVRSGLGTFFGETVPAALRRVGQALPGVIDSIGSFLASNLPTLAAKAGQLLAGLVRMVATAVPKIVSGIAGALSGQGGGGGGGLGAAVAGLFAGLGGAILSQIPKLLPALARAAWNLISSLGGALLSALPSVLPALALIGPRLVVALASGLGSALGSLAPKILPFLASLPGMIGGLLLRALVAAGPMILSGIGAVVRWFALLPLRIGAALASLGMALAARFGSALVAAGARVLSGIAAVVRFFALLPFRVVGALAGFAIVLGALALRAVRAMGQRISAALPAVIAFFRSLPGRAASALAALPGRLASMGRSALARLRSAVSSGAGAVLSFFSGLPGRVVGALSGLGGQLASLGSRVMQGFVSGVRSAAGAVIGAVTGPIKSAIGQAKSILGVKSPSRVFKAIGADVGKGFVAGVTGEQSKINSVFKDLIADVVKAFRGRKSRIDDVLVKRLRAANTRLIDLAKKRDKIADTIKAANEKVGEVTRAALDFAALTAVAGEGPVTGERLLAGLTDRLTRIRAFEADIATLTRRGLSADLIGQLVEAGPEQGAALAKSLVASERGVLSALNATQVQIARSSTSLARTGVDAMFDAGAKAGEGFLAGLKAQQSEIQKLMTSIAKSVASTVKKTLKIRSPSRVLEDYGEQTLAGYLRGLDRLVPRVQAAMRAAAAGGLPAAFPSPRTRRGGDLPSLRGRGRGDELRRVLAALSAAQPRTVRRTEATITNNVTMPTADPNAVADTLSSRLAGAIR